MSSLENIILTDQEDWVVWELIANKIYSAKSMYSAMAYMGVTNTHTK